MWATMLTKQMLSLILLDYLKVLYTTPSGGLLSIYNFSHQINKLHFSSKITLRGSSDFDNFFDFPLNKLCITYEYLLLSSPLTLAF